MERVQRAIKAWKGAGENRKFTAIGVNRSESRTMIKVMRETGGDGGPWFYQYAIKNGILD